MRGFFYLYPQTPHPSPGSFKLILKNIRDSPEKSLFSGKNRVLSVVLFVSFVIGIRTFCISVG